MVVNALSFAADLIGENKVSSATDLNFVSPFSCLTLIKVNFG